MKGLIGIIILSSLVLFAVADAGQLIVVLFRPPNKPIQIATVYQKEKFSKIKAWFPPDDTARNFEFWAISDIHKVISPEFDKWVGRLDLTPTRIKTGAYGDSLHWGNADSVAVYDTRFTQ